MRNNYEYSNKRQEYVWELWLDHWKTLPPELKTPAYLSLITGIGFRKIREEYIPLMRQLDVLESKGLLPQRPIAVMDIGLDGLPTSEKMELLEEKQRKESEKDDEE